MLRSPTRGRAPFPALSRHLVLRLACALALTGAVLAPAQATPSAEQIAVLSSADVALYLDAFAAVRAGRTKEADAALAQVSDPVLTGHVLAERYLGPGYKASYAELSQWLDRYADHPGADDIHALALKRKPKKAAAPAKPETFRMRWNGVRESDVEPRRSAAFEKLEDRVMGLVRQDRLKQALALLDDAKNKKRFDAGERDALRSIVAKAYFLLGRDETAYDLAADVAKRNRDEAPLADWTAGLASFRMGQHARAASHFERLAADTSIGPWTRSAAQFWAARANLLAGQPQKVTGQLEAAASAGATFYAMLAQRVLGRRPDIAWTEPRLSANDLAAIKAVGSARRSIALAQLGESALASREIRRAQAQLDESYDDALCTLAGKLGLWGAQHALARAAGDVHPGAVYALPDIRPEGGFRIDPALIYAIAKQESKFDPEAVSPAGAVGLMQIMPPTAVHLTGDSAAKARLTDPAFNLTLGQNYIEELMSYGEPAGNIFMLAAAYNAGPGNMQRWQEETGGISNDPLMFIEAIPARETRAYIERVVMNYWMYSWRMGVDPKSLQDVAAGAWPVYAERAPQPRQAQGARGLGVHDWFASYRLQR